MSAFTESALLKKLGELNSSQQAIQTLSLWLIHHRKHHVVIIKTWIKELHAVPENKKLTFMYLANDVIQNSKKKGPEYGKEFAVVLPKVFAHIGETCHTEKLFASLGRILNIWEERGVYDPKTIKEFRTRLKAKHKDPSAGGGGPASASASSSASTAAAAAAAATGSSERESGSHTKSSHERREKRSKPPSKRHRHGDHHDKSSSSSAAAAASAAAKSADQPSTSGNGSAAGGGDVPSPYVPIGEPPEAEELIRALLSIENSASSDAAARECIAKLPAAISEVTCLNKLEDKDTAKVLSKQVNEAVDLLNDYNARLASEMEERTKLATMLREYEAEQAELLAQAEQRLSEYQVKLSNLMTVQKEINSHLSNLPDLTKLPDVTGGLAPLPSAGDLFNVHT